MQIEITQLENSDQHILELKKKATFLELELKKNAEEHLSKVEQRVRISEPEYVDIQFPGATELYRGIRRGSYPW